MSRSQAPWRAAKRAERARRQHRKERLLIAGIALLMIASMVAYGFYLQFFYFNKTGSPPKPPSSNATSK